MPFSLEEYLSLISEIERHDRLYFHELSPEISDFEYDQLVKRAEEIEYAHPDWVSNGTPTRRVGEQHIGSHSNKMEHISPMLSLSNTYSKEEILNFVAFVSRKLKVETVEFFLEPKVDGVAISLTYSDGVLVRALTRGDGTTGDEITAVALAIGKVPQRLSEPLSLEVRGEVFMPKDRFAALNASRVSMGLETWANPRNVAAGSVKLLDPDKVSERGLCMVPYHIFSDLITKQSELRSFLVALGFYVLDGKWYRKCCNVEDVVEYISYIESHRDHLPFDVDGVVIKVNDINAQKMLGMTSKSPRWARAYKFSPAQVETDVERIVVQVGRSGVLTPVAHLTPVFLHGSKIARATLHNCDEVERKDIREGNRVIIEKRGDVIPAVVRVVVSRGGDKWCIGTRCPACGSNVVRKPGEVAVYCSNYNKCRGCILKKILFFVSRNAMHIQHLGEKILQKLLEYSLVSSISDIYRLTESELLSLPGMKYRSVHRLVDSIAQSKEPLLSRLIVALGIPHVGKEAARLFAMGFGSLNGFMRAGVEDLMAIDGVGKTIAGSCVSFFNNPINLAEIEELLSLGIKPKSEYRSNKVGQYSFAITGIILGMNRDDIVDLIRSNGCRAMSSVNRKTDYLLVGESPGINKLRDAEMLGVPKINHEEFFKLMKIHSH